MTTPEIRISEALQVLRELGMPREQLNDRTAICLLALLNISPQKQWRQAENPLLGIRAILDFAREQLGVNYAENTRESVRKYSVKQLVSAGIVLHNPCLLYTSDAADERSSVDLGGRRIIKKKNTRKNRHRYGISQHRNRRADH